MVETVVLNKLDRDYCVSAVHINLILRTSIRIASRNYVTADICGHLMILTFMVPCIVNVFFKYNQKDATLYNIIFLLSVVYMFQVVSPSIIWR